MEDQTNLKKLQVGTKEATQLKPMNVKIIKADIQTVGDKGLNKVVLTVKHPDKEETIDISSVKFEGKGGKLTSSGLWIKLDNEAKIQKGTALATLLLHFGCLDIEALEGREVPTAEDEKGYLCVKAY